MDSARIRRALKIQVKQREMSEWRGGRERSARKERIWGSLWESRISHRELSSESVLLQPLPLSYHWHSSCSYTQCLWDQSAKGLEGPAECFSIWTCQQWARREDRAGYIHAVDGEEERLSWSAGPLHCETWRCVLLKGLSPFCDCRLGMPRKEAVPEVKGDSPRGDCQTPNMPKAGLTKTHESQSPVTSGPACLTPFFPYSNSWHFAMLLEQPEQHPQPRQLSGREALAPYSSGIISRDLCLLCQGVGTHTHLKLSPTKPVSPLGIWLLWYFPSHLKKYQQPVSWKFNMRNHFKPENGFVLKEKSKQNVLSVVFK